MISLATTEGWTARGLAVAVLLQAVELLQVRAAFSDAGVFSWATLRREHEAFPPPLRWVFAAVLPYPRFVLLQWLRIGLAVMLLGGQTWTAPILLFSHVATCVRFRGTFNGGSDHMTALVLLGVTCAWAMSAHPWGASASYVYVAVQLGFSYFLAGVAKLREPAWRSGQALASFASDTRYGVPRWARRTLSNQRLTRPLCWLVLLFECTYPAALTSSSIAVAYVTLSIVFHTMNALVFGLNRFLFAWAAAYPSLLFASCLSAH